MKPLLLIRGVDTLKINIKLLAPDGTLPPQQVLPHETLTVFEMWQEQARAQSKPSATALTFHKARMVMLPNGAQAWKHIIKNDCLQLSLVPRLKLPMIAKATLSSSYLWKIGNVQEAVEEVHALLLDTFGSHLALQAAQIDLCVDLVGLELPTEWEEVFITHAIGKRPFAETQKDKAYYRGRTLETINISGHGCPVSCKIYNKTTEIKQRSKDKTWFYPPWMEHGWNGEDEVWRVEFSLEREGLHEMELEDIYETIRNIKRLWEYCTYQWLRMVVPESDKNRTRWATHPTWQQLQGAFETYGDHALDGLGPLVRKRKRQANIEQGIAAMAGYATTLAAWDDEIPDDAEADELFTVILNKVKARWSKLHIVHQDIVREKKILYSQKA